jgi:hypothetical protein
MKSHATKMHESNQKQRASGREIIWRRVCTLVPFLVTLHMSVRVRQRVPVHSLPKGAMPPR